MQKFRWSKVYESSEEELMVLFRNRNIQASRIVSEAAGEQVHQSADLDSILWCAEGSLVVRNGSISMSLQPGDAVHITAQSSYILQAGISGFVCYESH